ncbi:MAG: hypothetical protein JJT87_12415 [Halomonas sp.]|nr:hypothetical protein [Halomonas sp.]MCC5902713.1 hypothetical protein [Halomonas sp.]
MVKMNVHLFQVEPVEKLKRLAAVAEGHSDQSHHCRRILLAIYNSYDWPLELNRLRALDDELVEAALAVIAWSTYSELEIHEYLDDGDLMMKRYWDREHA